MKIVIINGPNLNLLGSRETGFYGNETFSDYLQKLEKHYSGVSFEYFQSNVEGELINRIQEADRTADAIVLNAGGYTHTSVSIGDAIKAISIPVVEVHISNIHAREDFRSRSMISAGVKGIIVGFGLESYRLAIEFLSGKPL
jgi:3-dehydroquinate dehydratase-2